MAKVKQLIKKQAKNKSAKYSLTYRTTYKLRPIQNSSSYKYAASKTVNLSYKGT